MTEPIDPDLHGTGRRSTAADTKRAERSARAAELAAKEGQALELRKAGYTYQMIADRLGYKNHKGAEQAVKRSLARLTQPAAAELRTLENERLDHLQRGQWEQATTAGDGDAVSSVLKIMQRRASLNGLDAPQKQALTNSAGEDLVDLERLRALFFLATGERSTDDHDTDEAPEA